MQSATEILDRIEQGQPQAAEELLPLIYGELRRLAAQRLRSEGPGLTLDATALVHEAFVRLVDAPRAQQWNSRAHFFGAAAEAMRRILIERARRKQRYKHGGGRQRIEFDANGVFDAGKPLDVVALDEALERLATEHPARAELVKLRFFGGLTMPEAAAAQGVSLATAERHWAFAKAWLLAELSDTK